MGWQMYLKALPGLGLGVSITVACFWLFQTKFSPRQVMKNSWAHDAFQRWIEIADQRLKKAHSRVNSIKYVSLVIIVGITSFILSLYFFKNLTAAVFLTLAFMLLPDHFLAILIQRRRKLMADQLAQAIRIFAAEFLQTPQLSRGFASIAERIPNPVGKVFRDAHYDIVTGTDIDLVLASMMGKIDIEHGQMFVQLLRQAKDDASVASLFGDLVLKLEDYLDLLAKNTAGVAGERTLSMIMAAMPIPAYIFMVGIFPETTTFLVENIIGRGIITLAFGSIFIWTLLDRLMGRVEM